MLNLVTGGAGFIGSHLVKRLVELGEKVVVLDNFKRGNKLDRHILDRIELIEGDVRDEATVYEAIKDCNRIFHFAAVLGVDVVADNPLETMNTEIIGMRNVAKAAVFNKAKIIYASTSGVYGGMAIDKAVSEDSVVSPNSSYAIAKRYNEIYLKALYQETGLSSVAIRYFNVYGPRQDERMVIPRFIKQAENNEPITVFGNGKQTRDFTYIDDAITSTILLANESEGCEIFNVANSEEYSILELARIIKDLYNSSSTIEFIPSPKKRDNFEVKRRFGSSDKLYKVIGFRPNTPLLKGLSNV